MDKIYFVYILLCSDGSYYTGMTSDLESRIWKHKKGYYRDAYTFIRRPLKLVYHTDFADPRRAAGFERQVKGWVRAKKEALINGDYTKLMWLAECKNESSHKNIENN